MFVYAHVYVFRLMWARSNYSATSQLDMRQAVQSTSEIPFLFTITERLSKKFNIKACVCTFQTNEIDNNGIH